MNRRLGPASATFLFSRFRSLLSAKLSLLVEAVRVRVPVSVSRCAPSSPRCLLCGCSTPRPHTHTSAQTRPAEPPREQFDQRARAITLVHRVRWQCGTATGITVGGKPSATSADRATALLHTGALPVARSSGGEGPMRLPAAVAAPVAAWCVIGFDSYMVRSVRWCARMDCVSACSGIHPQWHSAATDAAAAAATSTRSASPPPARRSDSSRLTSLHSALLPRHQTNTRAHPPQTDTFARPTLTPVSLRPPRRPPPQAASDLRARGAARPLPSMIPWARQQ